jgi:hypothetical protein
MTDGYVVVKMDKQNEILAEISTILSSFACKEISARNAIKKIQCILEIPISLEGNQEYANDILDALVGDQYYVLMTGFTNKYKAIRFLKDRGNREKSMSHFVSIVENLFQKNVLYTGFCLKETAESFKKEMEDNGIIIQIGLEVCRPENVGYFER